MNRPGPALSVPARFLATSLVCEGDLASPVHVPVLLIPGTTVDPEEFSWNYIPAFRSRQWPFCAVTLPEHTTGDIQIAGEYVTSAIRTMYERGGHRRIQIVGHSQGGMLSRWSLRFWPDLRHMVDDVAGISPSNHGTVIAQAACLQSCPPADWQQENTSAFTAALNSYAETFTGISYTSIYTHTDEIVVPNLNDSGSSSLHTGNGRITNVALQDACPNDVTEHDGSGTYDNTAFQLVIDAFTHAGPASPSRIPLTTCADVLMPSVNKATFATDFAHTAALLEQNTNSVPSITHEPPLACYVRLRCPGATGREAKAARRTGSTQRPPALQQAQAGAAMLPVTGPPSYTTWVAGLLMLLANTLRWVSRRREPRSYAP